MVWFRSKHLFSLLCLCGCFFASFSLAAQQRDPFLFDSVRSRAMGGIHAALADDLTAIFSNPAGFVESTTEFSVAEISLGLYGPLFDLAGAVSETIATETMPDIASLVGPAGFFAGANLTGPFSVGWVGENLGFGFFNRLETDVSMAGSSVSLETRLDILAAGGYALRFPLGERHSLDAGFLFKGFFRYQLAQTTSAVSVEDLFTLDLAGTAPFDAIVGIGLDAGLRYTLDKALVLGLVCTDIYSPALDIAYSSFNAFNAGDAPTGQTYMTVRPRLNLGVMYELPFEFVKRYTSRVALMADYKDFLDLFSVLPRNPVLNASLGVEVVLLDALSLRAGIQDALLSLGAGMDLTFMRVDIAMRGIELGIDPGINPQMAVDLALLFRY